ncbi:hypothetical protein [Oceanisphaera profunda]|nr:hypothetical protein [Oceanisphaera profunda]
MSLRSGGVDQHKIKDLMPDVSERRDNGLMALARWHSVSKITVYSV